MIQVDHQLITPLSNVHGKPFKKQDYTDSKHKSPENYVSGNMQERAFSIPIAKSKRG